MAPPDKPPLEALNGLSISPSTLTTTSTTPPEATMPMPTAALPPLLSARETTADELMAMLNRTPLFMTELESADTGDPTTGEAENIELEAMKALVHEGTSGERARGWRERGNEVVAEGRAIDKRRVVTGKGRVGGAANVSAVRWSDAREFYTKALGALREIVFVDGVEKVAEGEETTEEAMTVAEKGKIEEACYSNRALCNLEMKNHGSCVRDCAAVLQLNPKNIKALHRSATSLLALDKLPAAHDACRRAIALDPSNASHTALLERIEARHEHLTSRARARAASLERRRSEAATLSQALASRGIRTRKTAEPPADVEDAVVKLDNPNDASSNLCVPVLLLYPTHAQTDLIKAMGEKECLGDHLHYILPVPWDEDGEFHSSEVVECFADSREGGLLRVGKRVAIGTVLQDKVDVVDGLVKIYVVPKARVKGWVEEMKKRRGK